MSKVILTSAILLFSMLTASAQQKSHRDIWFFSPDDNNASFITQKSMFANAPNLKERDIEVHEVVGLKAHAAQFKKFKASTQKFTFILVGKDGGEKLRSNEPVSLERLYEVIDAMPMRKEEMKQKP